MSVWEMIKEALISRNVKVYKCGDLSWGPIGFTKELMCVLAYCGKHIQKPLFVRCVLQQVLL
jgi:hypothetical protein